MTEQIAININHCRHSEQSEESNLNGCSTKNLSQLFGLDSSHPLRMTEHKLFSLFYITLSQLVLLMELHLQLGLL